MQIIFMLFSDILVADTHYRRHNLTWDLFQDYRVTKPKEFKVAVQKNLEYKLPSFVDKMEPRRSILHLIGVNLIFRNVCAVLAAPVQEMQEPEVIR